MMGCQYPLLNGRSPSTTRALFSPFILGGTIRSSSRASLCSSRRRAQLLRGIQRQRGSVRTVIKSAMVTDREGERAFENGETDEEKTFELSDGSILLVKQQLASDGSQNIRILSNLPGRILLHWGVRGGERGQRKGWRIPSKESWPNETLEYKRRALQTPFKPLKSVEDESDRSSFDKGVTINLSDSEDAESLLFVLKDQDSGQWYDFNGGNFCIHVSNVTTMKGSDSVLKSEDRQMDQADISDAVQVKAADDAPQSTNSSRRLLSREEIPRIPGDLAGVWAYMRWEAAGCPNRSKEESDGEYQAALREVEWLLRNGISMESLQAVANDGWQRYKSFIEEFKSRTEARKPRAVHDGQDAKSRETSSDDGPPSDIPDELIGVKAYLLWEEAGKPEGADFSEQAKKFIGDEMTSGKSLQQIEQDLRGPSETSDGNGTYASVEVTGVPESQQVEAESSMDVPFVGEGLGIKLENPLDLVHRSTPPRLAESRARQKETPLAPLATAAAEDESCVWNRLYSLGRKSQMLVAVRKDVVDDENSPVRITFTSDSPSNLVLHWGVKRAGRRGSWEKPPKRLLPSNAELVNDGEAAEMQFGLCEEEECEVEFEGSIVPLQRVVLRLPEGHGLNAISFVLRSDDNTRWWKDGDSNFSVPVPGPKSAHARDDVTASFDDEISRIIVDAEVNSGGWTLMHRFNKASDLIDGILNGSYEPSGDAMARIFVWLRYSAIRQLTWQRNYNTQPRILGSAQERLTMKLAEAHKSLSGAAQEWARLCLTTVGRGSNAQAVRDEILNIMHRNKIPELKGTWMEEFHQKLHNNTTPDDVPICEAYLAFLKSDGNVDAYWRTLSDAGVTRQRLESFDRPIVTEPVFYPEKKEALIRDFTKYLGTLKATHAGADLSASIAAASSLVPKEARGYLGYVLSHVSDPDVLALIEAAVAARTEIAAKIPPLSNQNDPAVNRDLLYLDLALEDVVRGAAERGAGEMGMSVASLMGPLLQNLALSVGNNEELCFCLKAWLDLPENVTKGRRGAVSRDEALRAAAVLDRIRRALAARVDFIEDSLGSVSLQYGQALGCEPWAVELFTQEVIRGGAAFAVSLILSALEPSIRLAAELGAWQVISPGSGIGRLRVVPSLYEIQDDVYDEPTVILARRVTGEEEVPLGTVAVVSGDAPDVLSHLAVRSRNMRVLFAACYNDDELQDIEGHADSPVSISTTAAGAVTWSIVDDGALLEAAMGSSSSSSSSSGTSSLESDGTSFLSTDLGESRLLDPRPPTWCGQWVVEMDGYESGTVGAKSKNLAGLRGLLPEWIGLPPSVTVPFGSFEELLKVQENKGIAAELEKEIAKATRARGGHRVAHHLSKCRELAASVKISQEAEGAIQKAMVKAGISTPDLGSKEWASAMEALRGVWASKFNDRAFYSTRKMGINFNSISMAVLIQAVVSARYAFVIHTVNPTNGDSDEIYCELVAGLGEAIVSGNVPGTALTFTARKDRLEETSVLMYPSKSKGIFVPSGSLIFRSDSNGEDLDGYAGAGLYDSITTARQVRRIVDYAADPIVVDAEFSRGILSRVARAGAEIEKALGGAQDIEGVVDDNGDVFVVQTRPQM